MQLNLTIIIVILLFLLTTRNNTKLQSNILLYPESYTNFRISRCIESNIFQPNAHPDINISFVYKTFQMLPIKTTIIFCKIYPPQPHHYRTHSIFTKSSSPKYNNYHIWTAASYEIQVFFHFYSTQYDQTANYLQTVYKQIAGIIKRPYPLLDTVFLYCKYLAIKLFHHPAMLP